VISARLFRAVSRRTRHLEWNWIEGDYVLNKILVAAVFSFVGVGAASAQNCPSAWPNDLAMSATADAVQLMANFNALKNCKADINNPTFTGSVVLGSGAQIRQVDASGNIQNLLTHFSDNNVYLDNNVGNILLRTGSSYGTAAFFGSNGNVGIGTSTTYDKLTVGGGGLYAFNTTSNVSMSIGTSGPVAEGYLQAALANNSAAVNLAIQAYGGYTGVGTTLPAYTLHINGTAYAVGAAGALSDARHKTNIVTLPSGALNSVMQLRPVTFQWIDPKDDGMRGQQMGLIAQEVQRVAPSVVLTQNNAEQTLGLKYQEIVVLLVKAVQEQQVEIAALKAQLATSNGTTTSTATP
jgi:hypothetical protein